MHRADGWLHGWLQVSRQQVGHVTCWNRNFPEVLLVYNTDKTGQHLKISGNVRSSVGGISAGPISSDWRYWSCDHRRFTPPPKHATCDSIYWDVDEASHDFPTINGNFPVINGYFPTINDHLPESESLKVSAKCNYCTWTHRKKRSYLEGDGNKEWCNRRTTAPTTGKEFSKQSVRNVESPKIYKYCMGKSESIVSFSMHMLLVGGLEHFLIFHILGIIIPIDFHIFQGGRSTTNQVMSGALPIPSWNCCRFRFFNRLSSAPSSRESRLKFWRSQQSD